VISTGPGFELKKAALPGTRLGVLEKTRTWINGMDEDANSESRAFLLLGKGGTGKSTIAHSLVQEFKQLRRLGAFFRFSLLTDIGPEHFFRTIARSIADLDPSYATVLMNFADSTLNTTTSPTRQLTELLTKPFKTLSALGTIVIVIDALDECPADHRLELIQCLQENIMLFPKSIRFIITSRPTEAAYLRGCSWVHTYDLESDVSVDQDIHKFVKSQLVHSATNQPLHGFDEERVGSIVASAEGLFQYAAVVCKEILDVGSSWKETPSQVYACLVTAGSQGLDALYLNILNACFSSFTTSQLGGFRQVMGWILHSQEPLSQQMLVDFELAQMTKKHSSLAASDSNDQDNHGLVPIILKSLGTLLGGMEDNNSRILPLHSSFRDFLLEESRSAQFFIGFSPFHHISLITASLHIMEQDLHFNMAFLENSYLPNSAIPDFEKRVKTGVSPTLLYTCQYWTTHLKMSRVTEAQFVEVARIHHFIDVFLAFWFEVLALEKCTDCAAKSLNFLCQWSKVS